MNLGRLALASVCLTTTGTTSPTSEFESVEEIFLGALRDILIQNIGVNLETAIFKKLLE